MTLRYPVKLEADDNGTVLATCPSLPEVSTFGEDDADALVHAVDAIEEALAARIAGGEDIPPGPERPRGRSVALPLMTSLKASLYRALRESGITRAELMRRLGWNRESVDRLFRLDHASRLDQIEAAFKALGKSVVLEVEEAGRCPNGVGTVIRHCVNRNYRVRHAKRGSIIGVRSPDRYRERHCVLDGCVTSSHRHDSRAFLLCEFHPASLRWR